MSGLTPAGFEAKTLEEIIEDLRARAQVEFGPNIKTSDQEVLGHLIGIMADGLFDVWEQSQVLYDGFNADNAQDAMLDNVASIVGLTREPATKATGTITASGTDTTTIPQGSIVAVSTTGAQFVTTAEAEIGSTTPGEVDIPVEAELSGAQSVLAGEVDQIITVIGGWDSVTNASDFTQGTDTETDSELRRRREDSLAIPGSSTDNAIRAQLLALDDIDNAIVISNRTLATDGFGIPAKAFRAVVWPDTADAVRVAETVFEYMPAGIEPDGTESYEVTDDQGITQTVKFSFATEVEIGIEIDLTTKTGFPADGVDQVTNAVLKAFSGALSSDPQLLQDVVGAGLSIGDDVEVLYLQCAASTVPGIKSMVIRLDPKSVAFPPVGTADIPISFIEIATLDSADLAVAVV